MSDQTIKISLEAYQELILRKISSGVPIKVQIDRILKIKKEKTNVRSKS